jgi:ADP-heptose:LPS heptosyltransferase
LLKIFLYPIQIFIFSLQHGIDPNDLNKPFNEEIIFYPINPEKDVEGLIALIHLMDIIITTDNSVVHISGAMGKPTILILPSLPEYKWGMKNSETSFHKSVTIIRNKNVDSWSDSL